MPNKTKIEWTDYTSNPIYAINLDTEKRGHFCSHASPGCENCYAEAWNKWRGNGLEFAAFNLKRVRFELNEKELASWARLKPGSLVFPFDMTDLFQDGISDEMLDRVFDAMARSKATFQVLTKRAERLSRYFARWALSLSDYENIWLGVSVEDQRRKSRIDLLRQVPAALRFLSIEPLLEDLGDLDLAGIGWVIAGGESGPKARPCSERWVRKVVAQCREQQVPCFVKQLGRWIAGDDEGFGCVQQWLLSDRNTVYVPPLIGAGRWHRPLNAVAFSLTDPKGGKLHDWPEDLRVREMPPSDARECAALLVPLMPEPGR